MLDHQQQQLQVLSLSAASGYHVGGVGSLGLGQQVDICNSPPMVNLAELGEANLLEMLQVLTRRRDELRLMDKQLFDLMAECFVRLKPSGELTQAGQQAMDLSRLSSSGVADKHDNNNNNANISNSNKADDDNEEEKGAQNGGRKRGHESSPQHASVHVKKMRLLSGIVSQDDIGEKQQVLAEKELDVREGDEDDERKQGKRMIWKKTSSPITSSSQHSSSSSTTSISSPSEAYQQQQQQQQLLLVNETHRLAEGSTSISPIVNSSSFMNKQRVTMIYQEPQVALSAASIKQQLASGGSCGASSSGSDQDDEPTWDKSGSGSGSGGSDSCASSSRPQLKKFCSIGTAEMSFERFHRQQHLIDSTLATLVQQQQQQQQQQQASQGQLLVPVIQQRDTSATCFSLAPTVGAYGGGSGKQEVAMIAPIVLQQHQQQQLQQHGHFVTCEQGLACHGTSAAGSSLPLATFRAALPEHDQHQPLVYMQHQRQQKISPFDRMLVSAKDLAPIVRKMSFRCHVCSSCFEDRHRLQQHLSIHLNLHPSWFEEKTIKETMAQYELRRGDYLCQVCQLRFETTADFDKHMHLHGEKPHACELCQQDNKFVSFRYFRQLLTHLRSHCFLYSCRFVPECRQTANRKDYLKLHILKHHLNNKLPEQFTICCH